MSARRLMPRIDYDANGDPYKSDYGLWISTEDASLLEAVVEAGDALCRFAESYMKYHAEKFYDGIEPKPTGLWPAIRAYDTARAAVEGVKRGA